MEKIIKTDDEWRQILTEEQFRVTRKHGTEPAFSGALYDKHDAGTYHCICCGAGLFDSQTKFESGSGWPSFYAPMDHAHFGLCRSAFDRIGWAGLDGQHQRGAAQLDRAK